ncbi:hypothetical protein N44_00890 [Microcystis aeruginosa NIES-44]|jgi:hypothetical protein|uniref:Uncharacterized protein n=1 Tax=Microcystis aeruginosa NIES-44 TaxID=449439 RepID=A0A0A1VRA1_MICAE|nr:hypothetical protein N44_00890 [Microcystis aeruginosa NIES-44]
MLTKWLESGMQHRAVSGRAKWDSCRERGVRYSVVGFHSYGNLPENFLKRRAL